MLGVDELVFGDGTHVIYIVDEKGIGGRKTREEDDACAALCEGLGDGGADTGCSTLDILAMERKTEKSCRYGDHNHFRAHEPLGRVACAAEVELQEIYGEETWYYL